jgi:hypothetical protein
MQRFLILAGAILLAAGLFWPFLSRLGLGHLPGDIMISRPGAQIFIPLTSCLLLSVVLTLLFWVLRK